MLLKLNFSTSLLELSLDRLGLFLGDTLLNGLGSTVDNERKKLTVSVKIFGRKTPMELSFTQVEKE